MSDRFGNIKEKNLKQILRLIAEVPGISRAQLARETGLSKPAVSDMADELIGRGFVRMAGTDSAGHAGRRGVSLELNPGRGIYLSIALSEKSADLRIYDFALNLIDSDSYSIAYTAGCIGDIAARIKERASVRSCSDIMCTCFTLPAAVDEGRSGIRSTVLDLAPEFSLSDEILKSGLPGPKAIVNETIAYCYEEYSELYNGTDNMIFVEVSGGVGAGIVIGRKVFRGAGGSAGEFGHMSVDKNGLKCCCGRRGCLERYVSTGAIMRAAYKAGVIGSEDAGLAAVAESYAKGMPGTKSLYEDISDKLAFALGNMIAMFDITLIVVGGGIEVLGPDLMDMIRKKTGKYIISGEYRTRNDLEISYSALSTDSKNLGAVRYFRDNLLSVGAQAGENAYYI